MAKYRYIGNVKPSWNMTTRFVSVDPDGNEVTAEMGQVVDLAPKAAKELVEYFILEKIKEEATPAVENPKAATKQTFIHSLEGGE